MTRVEWDTPGERIYENGVDRGMLYIDYLGVAWSGLISVNESPSGGEARPFYLDGIKYMNLSAAEEYEATIVALSSPPEFAACDGVANLQNGLFASQQPRISFGLSYRTLISDDMNPERGYKIHIVYGALAAPAERQHNTLNDQAAPLQISWHITAAPDPGITGIKPTSHFVVDSTLTDPELLDELEGFLYGTELEVPYIPYAADLIEMFA